MRKIMSLVGNLRKTINKTFGDKAVCFYILLIIFIITGFFDPTDLYRGKPLAGELHLADSLPLQFLMNGIFEMTDVLINGMSKISFFDDINPHAGDIYGFAVCGIFGYLRIINSIVMKFISVKDTDSGNKKVANTIFDWITDNICAFVASCIIMRFFFSTGLNLLSTYDNSNGFFKFLMILGFGVFVVLPGIIGIIKILLYAIILSIFGNGILGYIIGAVFLFALDFLINIIKSLISIKVKERRDERTFS